MCDSTGRVPCPYKPKKCSNCKCFYFRTPNPNNNPNPPTLNHPLTLTPLCDTVIVRIWLWL